MAGHLTDLVKPRLGRMRATEVTRTDVAALSRDIVDGKDDFVASVSNARHMRRAVSGLYNWAIELNLVPATCQPCVKLKKLKEQPRERFLTEDEIRTLWHGLDRTDMPWSRRTRLCIKLAMVTMLRSKELLGAPPRRAARPAGADACGRRVAGQDAAAHLPAAQQSRA